MYFFRNPVQALISVCDDSHAAGPLPIQDTEHMGSSTVCVCLCVCVSLQGESNALNGPRGSAIFLFDSTDSSRCVFYNGDMSFSPLTVYRTCEKNNMVSTQNEFFFLFCTDSFLSLILLLPLFPHSFSLLLSSPACLDRVKSIKMRKLSHFWRFMYFSVILCAKIVFRNGRRRGEIVSSWRFASTHSWSLYLSVY